MAGDYRGASYSRQSSDDSDDASSMEEETTSSLYSAGKEYDTTPIEWTDEKHSLYLKSMEASFVDQLYNSLGSNLIKEENVPSRMFGSSGRKPCEDQFKVLRAGFWQKMNVKQPEYRVNGRRRSGDSREFLRSPWIKHYKPLPKAQTPVNDEGSSEPGTQVVNSASAFSLNQMVREGCSHSRDRDQISTVEEASDQNFVNEVTKSENGSLKKMKTVQSESSSTDQVVPLRKTPTNMT